MTDDPAPRVYTYPRLHIFRCSCGWHVWLILDSGRIIPKHVAESQEDALLWIDIELHSEPTA